MEFYNDKLLPKGLPEIIAEFTPPEIYADTRVITYSRKQRKGLQGQAGGDDDGGKGFHIKLWPGVICAIRYRLTPVPFEGTYSFTLWTSQLFVALHEVGHLVTRDVMCETTDEEYDERGDAYHYIEKVADEFALRSMQRILEVSPRMGQPTGPLTGYSGIKAYERRSGPFEGKIDHARMDEWRALKCDAQIPLSGVVAYLWNYTYNEHSCHDQSVEYPSIGRFIYQVVHDQAEKWNIGRYFTNRKGKKFLMFNAKEAMEITNICAPLCKENHVRMGLRTLYKGLGCLSDAEKDKDTLAWEKTMIRNMRAGIMQPFEGMELPDPIALEQIDAEAAALEPDDIPF